MLIGIDWVHSPIKHTYIAARLTGALVKCKWKYKESFGDYFSRPRQYTSSILAPSYLKIAVGVATNSKNIQARVFPLIHWVFNFLRSQKIMLPTAYSKISVFQCFSGNASPNSKIFSPYAQISRSVETRPEAAVTKGTGNLKSFCDTIQHTVTHATGKFCRHLTASYGYIEIML